MTTQESESTGPLAKPAETAVPLHPLLAGRWSPRSFDRSAELSDEQFKALFEAARWAPSWGNTQPARFIAGRRGEDAYKRIYDTLARGNRSWADAAAALVLGVARSAGDEGDPMPYGEYGLGLAAQNLVLQAEAEGLVAHQMAGFDREAARAAFAVPDDHEPLVAIAVGPQGPVEQLDDRLREKEAAPRSRKELGEIVFDGTWNSPRW
ncbi:nitroreductase family protein [Salinifilum aidingensis]